MQEKEWLVEIRLNDWVNVPVGQSRTVTYEEVLATSNVSARLAGIRQFANKCKYSPVLKRRMQYLGISPNDCCAPDAVEI